MRKFLLVLIFTLNCFAGYIDSAIVACQTLDSIKKVEPYIHKNSNKYPIPKDCLILTKNADVSINSVIEENYLQITVDDLNLKMYTLKSLLNTI